MDSIRLKTQELLTYHCGCHGNPVTIAARYVVGAYRAIANMDSMRLKTKELQSKMYLTSDSLTHWTHKKRSTRFWLVHLQ